MNWFVLGWIISLGALIGSAIVFSRFIKGRFRQRTDIPFQIPYLAGMGLFLLAVFAILVPVYAYSDQMKWDGKLISAFYAAVQAFTINLSAPDIMKMIEGSGCADFLLRIYIGLLFVAAPILTIGALLSLMKDFFTLFRLWRKKKKGNVDIFVFSELNTQSVALAQSINRSFEKEYGRTLNERLSPQKKDKRIKRFLKKRILLVFTDVHSTEEETLSELLEQIYDLGAMTVKRDIITLKLFYSFEREKVEGVRLGIREFFIIGSDATENSEHMIKLNEKCRDYPNYAVYLFSSSETDGYILDTLNKGDKTINPEIKTEILNTPADFINNKQIECQNDEKNKIKKAQEKGEAEQEITETAQNGAEAKRIIDDCYYIRRIDCVNDLAVRTLKNDRILTEILRESRQDKIISVLLVGLGQYGEAFLKNMLWLYQVKGYDLCIHVIDEMDKEAISSKIRRIMPDVADHCVSVKTDPFLRYEANIAGDCRYDIRIYPSVDCTSVDWNSLFEKVRGISGWDDPRKAFFKTKLVVVALGSDDINIETAMEIRRIFDRENKVDIEKARSSLYELPVICSVVYEDQTVHNLNCSEGKEGIVNYKAQPYHIHFIGRLSDQYNYEHIRDLRSRENEALQRHLEWIFHQIKLRKWYYEPIGKEETNRNAMLTAFKKGMDNYFNDHNKQKFETMDEYISKEVKGEDKTNPDGKKEKDSKILPEVIKYSNYEYFRNSSIARADHKNMMIKCFTEDFYTYDENDSHADIDVCTCEKCEARMISEHMRWAAHLRVQGYRFSDSRNDRAKLHDDLISWYELPYPERFKD